MGLEEIRKILKENSTKEAKASCLKFCPTVTKLYGVRTPLLSGLAKKIKDNGFELTEQLWRSGYFEEKILAAKILSRFCKTDPDRTLKLIYQFSKNIEDWAVCDTLATQGIRPIAKTRQKELFDLSRKLVTSKNLWQRRFGLVILINFTKDMSLKKEIMEITEKVKEDKEMYIKKAVIWLISQMKKPDLLTL